MYVDTGAPIDPNRVSVELRPLAARSPGESIRVADDGTFEGAGYEPGTYDVYAQTDRFRTPSVRVTLGGGPPTEVTLRFPAPERIAGRVLDLSGAPLAEARVEAKGPGGAQAWTYSGADGRFELTPVFAGTYDVFAETTPFDVNARSSARTTAGTTDLVLRLPRPIRLRGRALGPQGTPLPALVIEGRRVAMREGAFTWQVLIPSMGGVVLEAPGHALQERKLPPNETEVDLGELRFELGTALRGRIVDDVTDRPIAGAKVFETSLFDPRQGQLPGSGDVREVATSLSDGRFKLAHPSRRAELMAIADGYLLGRASLPQSKQTLEIRMEPAPLPP